MLFLNIAYIGKRIFSQAAQTVLWVCYHDALGDGDRDRHEVKNHVLTYKHSLMGMF